MTKKKILIIGGVVLSTISIIYIISSKNKGQINNQKISLPEPDIKKGMEEQPKVVFKIKKEDFPIPTSVPLLKAKKLNSFTKDQAISISSKFGFGLDYVEANDVVDGTVLIWNDTQKSLVTYLKDRHVVFTQKTSLSPINKQITENSLINIAKKYIEDKNLVDSSRLANPYIEYLSNKNGEMEYVQPSEANVYKITFNNATNNFKIFKESPGIKPISAWINTEGDISKIEIYDTYEFTETTESYEILTYDELKNNIDKAIVVEIDNGYIIPQDSSNFNLGNISINNVELGYYEEKGEDLFQPIFVLYGTLPVENQSTDVTLYLPALK